MGIFRKILAVLIIVVLLFVLYVKMLALQKGMSSTGLSLLIIIILISMLGIVLSPFIREIQEEAKARKAAGKPKRKSFREELKNPIIKILLIFDIIALIGIAYMFVETTRHFPMKEEFAKSHQGEIYVTEEYLSSEDNGNTTAEIEFTRSGQIKLVYHSYTTFTRHIDWKLNREWKNFRYIQAIEFQDPFNSKWISLKIIYEDNSHTNVLRMEGNGLVFTPVDMEE